MVMMAFFNAPENEGGHDPVDFTPSGMEKAATKDIRWAWMSLAEKDAFFAKLDDDTTKLVYKLIHKLRASGRDIVKYEQIDEELQVPKYCIPVEWGTEDMSANGFKALCTKTGGQARTVVLV